ncbi:hypothetical protein C8F04DRAFT_1274284 [Mycena alexandri]|uniref:DUF6818 domain-containing protein n=1 Tax=Mycena alexandri TaxID=1745969 RepID=A0AAD6WNE3_9AGAR|nr:hypothetical protein C8F04DRAFT_1274284 [Mycena alexandri]
MPDPPFPPFSQLPQTKPELHYDGSGNPWFRDQDGQWVRANAEAQMPQPLQASFQHNLPVQSAQQAYNFPPAPQASSSARAAPNNLRLPPLREPDIDPDLSDGPMIAKLRGIKPALKVGSVRQKGKHKRRNHDSDSDSDTEERPTKRGPGRPAGTSNFSKKATNVVLDLVQKHLPTGPKGWDHLSKTFNRWAVRKGKPERPGKSVENRYKHLLKHKKPTGDPHCPDEVKRAHRIEALINQSADTCELSDSDVVGAANDDDDDDDGLSNDSVEILASSTKRTAVARRAPSPPLRRRLNAPELVDKLSKAFDPAAQKARDADRAERSFQNTHMLALTGQLRDSQSSNDQLRREHAALQSRIYELERARDRAEMRLEFHQPPVFDAPSTRSSGSRFKNVPDVVRVNGHVKCETVYPEGGRCTTWIPDYSDDEKENEAPIASTSRLSHDTPRFDSSSTSGIDVVSSTTDTGVDLAPAPSTSHAEG